MADEKPADKQHTRARAVPFAEVANLAFTAPDKIIRYGAAPQNTGEYWQANQDAPLLLLVHGGCWLNQFDANHIRPLASRLAELGVAVLSIEYRRIGDEGGGFPGTFDDIREAANFAQTLPHDTVVVAGHSAGGHLALWLSASQAPEKLRGAIGLAPISDLETYAQGTSSCERAAATLMGGSPDELPERYHDASPQSLTSALPALIIHGEKDPIVTIDQSSHFCRTHSGCELKRLEHLGHFDAIDPRGAVPELIVTQIRQWQTP